MCCLKNYATQTAVVCLIITLVLVVNVRVESSK
jgi:hypothetical protein